MNSSRTFTCTCSSTVAGPGRQWSPIAGHAPYFPELSKLDTLLANSSGPCVAHGCEGFSVKVEECGGFRYLFLVRSKHSSAEFGILVDTFTGHYSLTHKTKSNRIEDEERKIISILAGITRLKYLKID